MKEYKVKKKKIRLLTKDDYEKLCHNEERVGKTVDFNKKEAGRAMLVNMLTILMGLMIAIPIMIFESIWLGLGVGAVFLSISIYRLVKNIKICGKYKNREQAIQNVFNADNESLVLKNSQCFNCSNKVEFCLNVFTYECGRCKQTNAVTTAANTEIVAGSLPIRKILAGLNKKDYLKINERIINYLKENPEYFKHKCKCRTTNEFQEAAQQYKCPYCGSINTLKEKVL